MRLLLLAAATSLAFAPAAVAKTDGSDLITVPKSADECPRATSMHAYDRSKPLKPRKLNELPPATSYMAVYRTIAGCEVPMTVVEYRSGRRP